MRPKNIVNPTQRVKFNTVSNEDQIIRDKNRNVFLIDSFTATLYIFGRVPLSFIVHFYLVKVKVPDSIGIVFDINMIDSDTISFAFCISDPSVFPVWS